MNRIGKLLFGREATITAAKPARYRGRRSGDRRIDTGSGIIFEVDDRSGQTALCRNIENNPMQRSRRLPALDTAT
ncbi:hypothetical protein [Bradyrhizobium sp. NAS96.2]|uniref:hypothetical protein n=1 Tax=Bradyrhizobium sp. NAS96.2 TaxID=1680160 RepID=UPI00116104D1|nr:hypothetical protein [Bradyrhizobium sp. NAS96.2]